MKRRDLLIALALGLAPLTQACTTREVVGVEIGVVTTYPSLASLIDGQSLLFSATVRTADGELLSGATVTWSTDRPQVISIDDAGRVEAIAAGTATVRASFGGVHGTALVDVYPAPGLVLSENSVAFRAVVGAASPSPVVLQVLNNGVGTVEDLQASVTFAPGQPTGWLTPSLADTETPTTLTLTPETSSLPGGAYEATLTLESDDDDSPLLMPVSLSVAGFTVTQSDGSTLVAESGITDTITVVFAARPASDVVVEALSGDTTHVTVTPTMLTFTPANWDQPRTVLVAAPNDDRLEGDMVTALTVAVVDSVSDPAFAPVPDEEILVTTLDDEMAGVTIVESGGRTIVTQTGEDDDFTVVLTAQPTSPVVIDVRIDDPALVEVSTSSLTFTATDWSTPQVVAVTAVVDRDLIGYEVTSVTLGVDPALSDDGFDAVPEQSVRVIVTDGVPPVIIIGDEQQAPSG
ncbi:MAG: Ig-like domain-containing protein [Gemmatimonadota bacterium]|nr:Ig-like domain-containing protein [Gemmatimonadota bacterium]